MKEFCNDIRVLIILEEIKKKQDFSVDSFDLFPYRFSAHKESITTTLSKGEYGVRYNLDVDIPIDLPSKEVMRKFSFYRRTIVAIETIEGEKYYIGSRDFPSRVIIRPELNGAFLNIKYSGIRPIIDK